MGNRLVVPQGRNRVTSDNVIPLPSMYARKENINPMKKEDKDSLLLTFKKDL